MTGLVLMPFNQDDCRLLPGPDRELMLIADVSRVAASQVFSFDRRGTSDDVYARVAFAKAMHHLSAGFQRRNMNRPDRVKRADGYQPIRALGAGLRGTSYREHPPCSMPLETWAALLSNDWF
jgi:hypothetical protein